MNVDVALADGAVHGFKIKVADLAFASVVLYALCPCFAVSLIPIDQNGG